MKLEKTKTKVLKVSLKDTVSQFTYSKTQFIPNTEYRTLRLTNGSRMEYLIYGEIFDKAKFEEYFEIL